MRISKFSVAATLLFGVFAIAGQAHAQASRATPKPLATPPPVLSAAEIISRANDYVETPLIVGRVPDKAAEAAVSESDIIKILNERIKKLESTQKADKDEKQKRLLLNLDILTRAEQRSESLRKQVFEMIEKENSVSKRLEQIEIDIRPEAIERSLQMAGSMKPEEVRENRRKSLDAERRNLQSLLTDIQATRNDINLNLQKSEIMVEKIRIKLEKDIDESFLKDDDPESY